MNKILYRIFIALVLITGSGRLLAQDVRVNAVLDSSKIRIGEQVKLDLYLNYDASQKNIHIDWPQIGDTLTEKVEVVSITPIDTTFPDKGHPSNLLQHQQIIVSAYDSGYFAIPGFKFILDNDTAHPLYTQPLFLEVHTVPTDTSATKIKDIKPPFAERFNWKWYLNYIYFGGALLLLIIIVIIITVYLTKRRKNVVVEPEKPKIPPHIIALASLEKIKEDQVWKEEKIKEYYSSISEAVRLYIEERFHVNALESTTDEIMQAFRSQVVDKESKDKLQQLLMLSDLVKFAKQFPIESEHQFTLQNAFDFVNGTKRDEEVSPETLAAASAQAAENVANSITNSAIQTSTNSNTTANSSYAPSYYPGGSTAPPKKKKEEFTPYVAKADTESKSKVLIRRILIAIAAILTIALIVFIKYRLSSGKSFNTELAAAVSQANSMCPVNVDSETRLDNVAIVSKDRVAYNYTLIHVSEGQINAEAAKGQMEGAILEQVKTSPMLAPYRENNITMEYNYSDKDGKLLFTIIVTPEDYKTNS